MAILLLRIVKPHSSALSRRVLHFTFKLHFSSMVFPRNKLDLQKFSGLLFPPQVLLDTIVKYKIKSTDQDNSKAVNIFCSLTIHPNHLEGIVVVSWS